MITKFKIFEKHEDIDPYGEEDWNDDEKDLIMKYHEIIKQFGFDPKDIDSDEDSEFEWFDFLVKDTKAGDLQFTIQKDDTGNITLFLGMGGFGKSKELHEPDPLVVLFSIRSLIPGSIFNR